MGDRQAAGQPVDLTRLGARVRPTICKSSLRTVNTQAKCGSPEDFYYWAPWRAPGSAPVIDSCGSAGGRFPGMPIGGAGAQYQNTSLATRGTKGSALPPLPSGSQATWKVSVTGTLNRYGHPQSLQPLHSVPLLPLR